MSHFFIRAPEIAVREFVRYFGDFYAGSRSVYYELRHSPGRAVYGDAHVRETLLERIPEFIISNQCVL